MVQATPLLVQTGEMLIQSSPCSIEAVLSSFVSTDRKQDLLCDWIPRAETWKTGLKLEELSRGCCKDSISTEEAHDGSSLDHYSCCRIPSASNMSASSSPNLVYKRRKMVDNSSIIFSAPEPNNRKEDAGCLSNTCLKDDGFDQSNNITNSGENSAVSTGLCNSEHICNGTGSTSGQILCQMLDDALRTNVEKTKSESESLNNCPDGEEQHSDKAHNSKSAFEYYKENDSFSSSKSTSLNIKVDDNVECSSSEDLLGKNISAKELCISILMNHGLLKRNVIDRTASADCMGINDESTCFQLCKACGQKDSSLNMLLCDKCEDAYHVSCCNPKVQRIPLNQWHCQFCSRKKLKDRVEPSTKKSPTIKKGSPACKVRASKGGSSLIQLMLEDCEPYTTDVRIGDLFQADVPEWRGPILEEYDCFGEPSEVDVQECGAFDELNSRNTNRLSTPTVGNWLQCREVDKDTNTICGKYRRAPLFEVQNDDWDCFCSVLWDPIHSDCAVPQELDTDQVLVHLKYIELLRPRLASKKRKPS